MGEAQRIDDQLKRTFEGDAWHGPALLEVLENVTAEQAAVRPIPGAHTIWELVHHIAAWEEVVSRRLDGEPWMEYPVEKDWPPVRDEKAASWDDALGRLANARSQLRETVTAASETRLAEIVPNADYSFYVLVHGTIQHGLYHAGQIVMLKKALATAALEPERTSFPV